MPEIVFGATDPWVLEKAPAPIPAAAGSLEWLRKTPVYGSEGRESAPTIRRCAPTRDAELAGYLLRLPRDVTFVRRPGGRLHIESNPRGVHSPVGKFPKEQLGHFPIPHGFEKDCAYKWVNPWTIRTPPGYSVTLSHPKHESTSAFWTFSAVVDTDTWASPVNLAFLLREDFEGLVPAGTPIARVVPFRRESWSSRVVLENPEALLMEDQRFKTSWEMGYQREYRQNKAYS